MEAARPLLFTVEFRRKMAELSKEERQEWLTSISARVAASPRASLAQELHEVARGCRLALVESVERHLGPFPPLHLRALLEVPRERFVRPEDIARSSDDTPLPLDESGLATISAPHAYLLSFRLLDLGPGDSLVELGAGSGYGAALAAFIVGSAGRVLTFEIDSQLFEWSARTLSEGPDGARVEVVHADAVASAPAWLGAKKIVATFAVDAVPGAWLDALPEGGALVAPVGAGEKEQQLVLVRRVGGRLVESEHGAVRYVKNRSSR